MFGFGRGSRKEIFSEEMLREWFNDICNRITQLERVKTFNIDCEICGCLIRKENAVKGESKIQTEIENSLFYGGFYKKEYIHSPYYCKRCAPKTEGDKIHIGKVPNIKIQKTKKEKK